VSNDVRAAQLAVDSSTEALIERRSDLQRRVTELRSRHSAVAADLDSVEAEWSAALAAGSDTASIVERRRAREADLADLARELDQVGVWAAEAQQAVQRRQASEQLDADLTDHDTALTAYAADLARLDGAHAAAVDAVAAAVMKLHRSVNAVRHRHAELTSAATNLRIRAVELDRADSPAGPTDWQQPLETTLRNSEYWVLYLTSIQPRGQHPAGLVQAVADAAHAKITTGMKRGNLL
jgi:chromosome segregation ATPase